MVLTIAACNLAGKIDNVVLGNADLQMSCLSGICSQLHIDFGFLRTHTTTDGTDGDGDDGDCDNGDADDSYGDDSNGDGNAIKSTELSRLATLTSMSEHQQT